MSSSLLHLRYVCAPLLLYQLVIDETYCLYIPATVSLLVGEFPMPQPRLHSVSWWNVGICLFSDVEGLTKLSTAQIGKTYTGLLYGAVGSNPFVELQFIY